MQIKLKVEPWFVVALVTYVIAASVVLVIIIDVLRNY